VLRALTEATGRKARRRRHPRARRMNGPPSLIEGGPGHPWLWSCRRGTPLAEIVRRLGFAGEPVSELSARSWVEHGAVMDGLAADVPMPDYFGRNWDAVDECVADLCADGRLIVVRDIHPAARGWVALFADCVGSMWARGAAPHGRVALVLDDWPTRRLTARWTVGSTTEHEVTPLDAVPGSGLQGAGG
jgi:hypothetical protein